jgi:hypothetical protein
VWYYLVNNQQIGPVPEDQIKSLLQNQAINIYTLVWKEGMTEWKPLSQTELTKLIDKPFPSGPPQIPLKRPAEISAAAIISLVWGIIGVIRACPVIFVAGFCGSIFATLINLAPDLNGTGPLINVLIVFFSLVILVLPSLYITIYFLLWYLKPNARKFGIGLQFVTILITVAAIVLPSAYGVTGFNFFSILGLLISIAILVLLYQPASKFAFNNL